MQWTFFLIFNTKTNHSHRILPFDSIAINMLSMGIERLQHLSGIYHVSISCQRTLGTALLPITYYLSWFPVAFCKPVSWFNAIAHRLS